ncbi:MAG: hypothetical protein WDZ28_01985 [Simkaniaceae bacterium]
MEFKKKLGVNMEFQGRALFNLLKIQSEEDHTLIAKPYQVENLRGLSTETLFDRLRKFGIHLDESAFHLYVENCETPEELADCLYLEDDHELGELIYLLTFELWRRLTPEKESLSLFCDELDYQISLFDKEQLEDEEPLQALLDELETMLDEGVDGGLDDSEVLQTIEPYLAHDIETFLSDYILYLIENDQETYGSELIEGFYEYVKDKKWFDFLRLHSLYASDPHEAEMMLERLIGELKEDPDSDLLLALLDFLVPICESDLFYHTFSLATKQIKTESDFLELSEICRAYFNGLDSDEEEKMIATYLLKRSFQESAILNQNDPDLLKLQDLMTSKFESV